MSEQKYVKIDVRIDHWQTILVPVDERKFEILSELDAPPDALDESAQFEASEVYGEVYDIWKGMSDAERSQRCFVIKDHIEDDFGFDVAKDNAVNDVADRDPALFMGVIPTSAELAIVDHPRLDELSISELRSIEADQSCDRIKLLIEDLIAKRNEMLPEDPGQAIELLLRTLRLARRLY
jgi:hypothetical protein